MRCTRARGILWAEFHESVVPSCDRRWPLLLQAGRGKSLPLHSFRTSLTLINDKWKMSGAVGSRQRWYFMCRISRIHHSKSGCLPSLICVANKNIAYKNPLRSVFARRISERKIVKCGWVIWKLENKSSRKYRCTWTGQKNNEWSLGNLLVIMNWEKDKRLSVFPERQSDN